MAQDPNSGYNPDPEKPYDVPSTYETPAQLPYDLPSTYETLSQPPYDLPSTYETPSQPPYGESPETPYEAQQQYSYGIYGTPGYNANQGGYDYEASAPLPLDEAIRQLPNQYIKVFTKSPSFTFVAEMGKASWDILWVQLIPYAVITGILRYLQTLTNGNVVNYNTPEAHQLAAILQAITLGMSFGAIIITPAIFFLWQGIIYFIAKAFDGDGTFLRQGYTYLLIWVPIGITSSLLGLIPGLGGLIGFGLGIYGIVLQIFSLMAVHHLSGIKVTGVFLISALILFVIIFVFLIVLALAIVPTPQ